MAQPGYRDLPQNRMEKGRNGFKGERMEWRGGKMKDNNGGRHKERQNYSGRGATGLGRELWRGVEDEEGHEGESREG